MKVRRSTGIRIAVVSGVIFLCLTLIALPFFRSNKQETNYRELSSIMQSTFTRLQSVDSASSWRYEQSCSDVYTGAFATGDIICKVSTSLQSSVTDMASVNRLQNAYYPIINNASDFTGSGSLNKEPVKLFGKKFVVSSAERQYVLTNDDSITCRYTLSLGPQSENSKNFTIGKPIENNNGTIKIIFTCSGPATSYWYDKASA